MDIPDDLMRQYTESSAKIDAERQKILSRLQALQQSSSSWQQIEKEMQAQIAKAPVKIKIDCGGSMFHTSKTTLLRFKGSLFYAILATDIWDPRKSPDVEKGVYFFDRDPLAFDIMLDYLRDSVLDTVKYSDVYLVNALKGHLEFFEVPFVESLHNGKLRLTHAERVQVVGAESSSAQGDSESSLTAAAQELVALDHRIDAARLAAQKKATGWDAMKAKVRLLADQAKGKVSLDIGGKIFSTTQKTLSGSEFFSAMATRWEPDEDGHHFIDKNPRFFPIILNYLRTGVWNLEKLDLAFKEEFLAELNYFGLDDDDIPQLHEAIFVFDDSYRPDGLQMSEDKRRITKTSAASQVGAFGNIRFSTGRHSWKCRIESLQGDQWIAFGVSHIKTDDYRIGWGISSSKQILKCGITGTTTASGDWKDGDIIKVDLDWDRHEVTITNERTGRSHTVPDLPAVPLMPWVNVFNSGNSVSLI
eukprot:TRINITY_DN502_c0_g1_i1.p1 TRINITY_DN502_c0_g1~~TRINITY_DN502_c0_g1_i1.p1  ORF type:complete len:499 (-),score=91.80 TRINITY_DN502_c0_g1_i1:541-1962(-)